jgi:sarcosine oxidase subunit gamma
VSGHDPQPTTSGRERSTAAPLTLLDRELDVVELAALSGQSSAVVALARGRGVELPALGRVSVHEGRITLCVRPARWLLMSPHASAGAAAGEWHAAAAGIAAVIDQSSALRAFWLEGGPAIRTALARGCRLDLDPEVFPAGHAAATIIVQVSVILVSLAEGILLLTPSTTARHFREWLAEQVMS